MAGLVSLLLVASLPPGPAPAADGSGGGTRSGYWLLTAEGEVHAFGDARHLGAPAGTARFGPAVDLEATRTGDGYWVVDERGRVAAFGAAAAHGTPTSTPLPPWERVTGLEATPSGDGYWLFTDAGRVFPFGAAHSFGDMAGTALNGPVLDAVSTPSGRGYWMVGSDGGVFSFGDARFSGSMGGIPLNAPVRALAAGESGYWLVAEDGGVFSFGVPFRGSMGGQRLNAPVVGMVARGDGYLLVGADGGVFNFSNRPFHGSLGADPPAHPVVALGSFATAPESHGSPTPSVASPDPAPVAAPPVPIEPGAVGTPGPVHARHETPPARGDADDPAIWVHPQDPARSLVIGTDKHEGLAVYDLHGRELQFIDGIAPNNVDLRGELVVAADDSRRALLIYRVDAATRTLERVGEIATAIRSHGLCLYEDPAGLVFAFGNDLQGRVEQWQLVVGVTGVTGRQVRVWDHGGTVEGCVADDRTGTLYLSEEATGVWRYGAGPADPVDAPRLVGGTTGGQLVADVEGLAVLRMAGGDVLLVSSQGDSHYAAYDLVDHRFLTRFRMEPGGIDACEQTDGIEVTEGPLGPAFPHGLFVCQDGIHEGGTNFKLVPREQIVALIQAVRA